MLFGEKLLKLRKESNMSQEVLAEKLGTTRQAVSKWENGQGFPETEKLLLIGNLFKVSIDYLLKDTVEEADVSEKGYYVSKEMAEGYISNQKKWLKQFSFGGVVLLLSITTFLKYNYENLTPVVMIVMILFGGFFALKGIVSSDDKYKVLEKEPLMFDAKYLIELKLSAERITRKYTPVFIASFVVMLLCVTALTVDFDFLPKDFTYGIPLYVEIVVAALAVSASIMFYTGTMIESYQLLAKNEEHIQGFWFRVCRKIRKKADELLK